MKAKTVVAEQQSRYLNRWILFAGVMGLLFYPLLWGIFAARFPYMEAYLVRSQHEYWGWFVGYIVVLEWLIFGLTWYSLRRAVKGLAELGFPLRWHWWQGVVVGGVGIVLIIGGVLVGLQSIGKTTTIPLLPVTVAERILMVLLLAPTAAIVEETIFRGFALTYLPSVLWQQRWLAWLIAAGLFALMHGDWRAPFPLGAINFGWRFAFSLIMSVLFVWKKSLKLPMILHWFIDASTALVPAM